MHLTRLALVLAAALLSPRAIAEPVASSPLPAAAPASADAVFAEGTLHTIEINVQADLLKLMDPAAARKAVKVKPELAAEINLRDGPVNEPFAYVRSTVTFDGQALKDVGLRYKGHLSYASSRSAVRRPMKLDFERFVDGRKFAGLAELNLNNQAVDPSQAREALAFSFLRALNVPAPRTSFALVYLNAPGAHEREFLGLYTLVEEIDKRFIRRQFGKADGLLMKPGGMRGLCYLGEDWAPYESKLHPKDPADPALAKRMIELSRLIQKADDPTFAKEIAGLLDIDGLLAYVAVNSALCNFDSFLSTGHNYYLYISKADPRAKIITWDQNMTFGGYSWVGTEAQIIDTRITHAYVDNNRLIERLLAIPPHRESYLKKVRQLIDGPMSLPQVRKQLAVINTHIQAAGVAAQKSGIAGSPTTRPASYERVYAPELLPFIEQRIASLRAQLDQGHPGYLPAFDNPERVPAGWAHAVVPAAAIMKALDLNADGNITDEEFAKIVARGWPSSRAPSKQVAAPTASAPELANSLIVLMPDSPKRPALAKTWSEWLVKQADGNRDARLTPAELTAWFTKVRTRLDRDYDGQMASREMLEALMSERCPKGF